LDILVQSRRDKKAAKKFFRKLLKGLRYVPRVLITDKLRSYSAAKAEVLPSVEHCQDKGQNNRAENSQQPTRLRERVDETVQVSGPRAVFSRPSESLPHTSEWGDIYTELAVTE
jgi:transposase-like protein